MLECESPNELAVVHMSDTVVWAGALNAAVLMGFDQHDDTVSRHPLRH